MQDQKLLKLLCAMHNFAPFAGFHRARDRKNRCCPTLAGRYGAREHQRCVSMFFPSNRAALRPFDQKDRL